MAGCNFFCSKFSFLFLVVILILILQHSCHGEEEKSEPKKRKEKDNRIGKNVVDYNEGDLFKLYDQWEVSTSLYTLGFFGRKTLVVMHSLAVKRVGIN